MPDHSTEIKIFIQKNIFRLYIIGMTMPPQTAVNFVGDAASASVMLNPLRLQILARLREPDSASGLSRQMNLPRQKLNIQERFSSAYLVAVAARAIHDLAVLRTRAARAGKQLATFTLETSVKLASAAELNAFAEELTKAVARLAAKYHDERARRGRTFKFIIGSYPAITKNEENLTKEASHAGNKTATENPRAPRRSRN
jgi:hypothetical protein